MANSRPSILDEDTYDALRANPLGLYVHSLNWG